ncbi:MAG: metallophosphoesterase, partial [Planctomycetaceae bacterium]|nr:metallophosphoesterase [Planctomycetaceae bacterium]
KVKVEKALKLLLKQEPKPDAVFVVGDITNSAKAEEFDQVVETFGNKELVPEGLPVYFAGGYSHDTPSDNSYSLFEQKLKQPLNQYITIKGYPFIVLGEGGTQDNEYNREAKRFLEEKLSVAAEQFPGKPVFVFVHIPPQDTVYGSWKHEGWGVPFLNPVLEKYPQAVVFSAHSHYPLADPRSIFQDKFTVINDGGLSNGEIEKGVLDIGRKPEHHINVVTGIITDVLPNGSVEVQRWDTWYGEEILPRWTIKAPHDGSQFLYKNRSGKPDPYFTPQDKPVIKKLAADAVDVLYPQATDKQDTENDVVHHYIIEIFDGDLCIKKFKQFSYYYLNSHAPKELSTRFTGLPSGKTLYASVTAVDAFKNQSAAIKSEPFTLSEADNQLAMNPKLQFRKDGKFTVMQMTDVHWTPKRPSVQGIMTLAINTIHPDLIVLTGDIVTDKPALTGWKEIVHILVESRIPWAVTFGNHDTEYDMTKPEIIAFLSKQPGNLTVNGPADVSGNGNYVLKIASAKLPQKTAAALYCFDSRQQDDWVDHTQIDWYRKESAAAKAENGNQPLPALAFFHIPFAEYKSVVEQVGEVKPGTVGHFGEKVCDPPLNSGLFCAFSECGDVMGTFVGHDHQNDYIGVFHNIALAYGYCTTLANTGYYMGIGRGVRVIELTEGKRGFTTYLVKTADEPNAEKRERWKVREEADTMYQVDFPESFAK